MIESLIVLVIYIIVLGLVVYVLLWAIDYVGLPEPMNKVARVVILIGGLLILLLLALRFLGKVVPALP